MNTSDPDRCPAGHDVTRHGTPAVVQCQGSINHDGKHVFEEDHYLIRWLETMPQPQAAAARHILLVDDNSTVLETMADTLRTRLSGVEVSVCLSAQRAFEAIASFNYDVVIVDQCMPEMSGTELITRVRAIRPTLPILLMSGHAGDGLASYAVEMGASGFLSKPLDGQTLQGTVEQVLGTTHREMESVAQ
jgi:DNA-binding NtrC family response regulator